MRINHHINAFTINITQGNLIIYIKMNHIPSIVAKLSLHGVYNVTNLFFTIGNFPYFVNIGYDMFRMAIRIKILWYNIRQLIYRSRK